VQTGAEAAGVGVCRGLTTVGGTGEASIGADVAVGTIAVGVGVCRGLTTVGGIGEASVGARVEAAVAVAASVTSGSLDGEGEVVQETTSMPPKSDRAI